MLMTGDMVEKIWAVGFCSLTFRKDYAELLEGKIA